MNWMRPQRGVLEWVLRPIPLLIAGVVLLVLSSMLDGFDDRVAAHEFVVTGTVTRVHDDSCLPLARHCRERRYAVQWQSPDGHPDSGIVSELGRRADVGDEVELVVDDRLGTPRAVGYATPEVRWGRIIGGALVAAAVLTALRRRRLRRPPRPRRPRPPASPISG